MLIPRVGARVCRDLDAVEKTQRVMKQQNR
jgi:hypothetical protein